MTTETPAVAENTAQAKPEKPAEPPFNVDVLNTCTARFTRHGWNLFLALREDLDAIKTRRIVVKLTARSEDGAAEIATLLTEAGVPNVKIQDKTLSTNTTFEKLQLVIRHPQTLLAEVEARDPVPSLGYPA